MNKHSPHRDGSARLRRGRHSAVGQIYLVTFTTTRRVRFFDSWDLALAATQASVVPDIWRDSRLMCWVLMPDHWHGLLELGGSEALSTLIGRLKAATAHAVNDARGSRGSIWAEGFHDHAIRADEDLVACARYIVLKPVRAGLARGVGQYPFWDAIWIDGGNRG